MANKKLNSRWFSEMGQYRPIGIIQVINLETDEVKYYIGTGVGESIDEDMFLISSKGVKFPKAVGYALFNL